MRCLNCGHESSSEDRFCSQCGTSLTGRTGGGPQAAVGRVSIEPLRFNGRHIQLPLFYGVSLTLAALGFLGAITHWGPKNNFFVWFVLFAISAWPFALAERVRGVRFVRVFGSYCLEANEGGELFITEIGGTCPICGGDLKLHQESRTTSIGSASVPRRTFVRCTENHAHYWHFDSMIMNKLKD